MVLLINWYLQKSAGVGGCVLTRISLGYLALTVRMTSVSDSMKEMTTLD
jgi:hypothetical protein